MLKKTMTYTDYNGNQRTEDFYFNLTKAELLEMDYSRSGGFEANVKKIMDEQDVTKVYAMFKDIVLGAYGEKSLDGKYFVKNPELKDKFSHTEAFSDLVMELISDSKAAANFINGIMPSDIDKAIEKAKAAQARNAAERDTSIINIPTAR